MSELAFGKEDAVLEGQALCKKPAYRKRSEGIKTLPERETANCLNTCCPAKHRVQAAAKAEHDARVTRPELDTWSKGFLHPQG